MYQGKIPFFLEDLNKSMMNNKNNKVKRLLKKNKK